MLRRVVDYLYNWQTFQKRLLRPWMIRVPWWR